MVCNRCILVVQQELEKLNLHPKALTLGYLETEEDLSADQLKQLDEALVAVGFERIDDRKARLIEGIKQRIIQMIHHSDRLHLKMNWSDTLADKFHYDYSFLSNLFSSVEGITLEHYIIKQKIERVKELLLYDELNLSEIARKLGYSSVAHLSAQFKKITGLTPTDLKKSRTLDQVRNPIDSIGKKS